MDVAKEVKRIEQLGQNAVMKFNYTRDEAAYSLGISVRTLDYLIARGELNTTRIGKKVLVPAKELKRYAAGSHPEATKPS